MYVSTLKSLETNISSVESQKGINIVYRYSIKSQKGAIVHILWL